MIIDLDKFIQRERPYWEELEGLVAGLEAKPGLRLGLDEARRLHYLYERASAALARTNTFSSDPDMRRYLETLVARSYSVIHSRPRSRWRFHPLRWFGGTLPRTFRRHIRAFTLSAAITLAGAAFGAAALAFDPDAKAVIIPWGHLAGDPAERVRREERTTEDRLEGKRTAGAAWYMTHNTQVSILAMALGLTWGVGTIVLLFYNGVILGAVVLDYVRAGQGAFLVGWLLPHGSIEIPAILVAGQAGLVLAYGLIGHGNRDPLKVRMRNILPSLVTLVLGVAVFLVWAGIIEAFFSQYHEPILPYWLKITFGCAQFVLLVGFLALAGRGRRARAERQA